VLVQVVVAARSLATKARWSYWALISKLLMVSPSLALERLLTAAYGTVTLFGSTFQKILLTCNFVTLM
jgi:hypothetical protein